MANPFHRKVLQYITVTQPDIPEAFKEAGMMVHGSGPQVVDKNNLRMQCDSEITEITRLMIRYRIHPDKQDSIRISVHRIIWFLLAVLTDFPIYGQSFRERLQPIPVESRFRMDGYWGWGGSAIRVGPEYHLFASRWPKKSKFPDDYVNESKNIRAVSRSPMGPYTFQEVVIGERDSTYWNLNMAHNPTIHKIGDTLHCVRRERAQLLIRNNRITYLFNGVYDGRDSWCQPQQPKCISG